MSTRSIYVIYDIKAKELLKALQLEGTHEAGIRLFVDVLQAQATMPNKYPLDFDLRYLGTVDTETLELSQDQPQIIYSGAQYMQERLITNTEPPSTRIGPDALNQLEII